MRVRGWRQRVRVWNRAPATHFGRQITFMDTVLECNLQEMEEQCEGQKPS